jgi:hypothetical protein
MSRTKKYNPVKRLQKNPHGLVANTAIYQLPEEMCNFIHVPSCSIISAKFDLKALAKVYTNVKFDWVVALVIFRIDSRGDKALDVHHVAPPQACKADLIAESVKAKHLAMIDKADPQEYIAAGWLAIPKEEYLPSTFLYELFNKLGVWENYVTSPANGYKLTKE